jgi:hypothetical protein
MKAQVNGQFGTLPAALGGRYEINSARADVADYAERLAPDVGSRNVQILERCNHAALR